MSLSGILPGESDTRPNITGSTVAVGYVTPKATNPGFGAFAGMTMWEHGLVMEGKTHSGSLINFNASQSNAFFSGSVIQESALLTRLIVSY